MDTTRTEDTRKMQTQASSYLSFYGLAREPFAIAIEFDLFYPEPSRLQQIDMLHHLIQYNTDLLLVTGPEGSGKSSLLQQFAAKASDTWEVARIEAKGGIDERNLMQQFYRQLEMNFRGATHPELLDQLQHHLDSLVHNARLGVLLVDDAHHLTVTALQRILQLATLRNFSDKPLLRVILFGEPELEKKLADPLLGPLADTPHRVIELKPFNEEHSTHYILHRLSSARFVANEPFTENVLHKIYKQSEGWPGRINALSHQKLLDSLPTAERPPELPGISDKALYKPRRLVTIGIITTLLLTLILWDVIGDLFKGTTPSEAASIDTQQSSPTDRHKEQARVQQDLAIPTPHRPDKPVATPAPTTKNRSADLLASITPHEHQPHPLGGTPMLVTEPPTNEPEPVKTERTAAPAAAPIKKLAAPVTTSTAKPPAPKASNTNTNTNTNKKTQPTTSDVIANKQWQPLPDWLPHRRHEWISSRNPQHFTLQMVAGERLQTLKRFIARHKPGNQIAFYQTTRKGQPWYALVYGDYPDKQSAIDARSQLPKKLRRLKPWIRNFDGIQKSQK